MPKVGMEPKRRADLINATLLCISSHGIDGMTLDKVAEYADCSKGVVTYYFKNKDNLIIEAFRSFLAYYGLKINSQIQHTMTPQTMIEITLQNILPPYSEDAQMAINVSELEGIERMHIPHEVQAKLFLHFFSKAVLDPRLQEVVAAGYKEDMQGIMKIFDYGKMLGSMKVDDSGSAAYGLLAMVVGLSFFKVANIQPMNGEDNRYICEDYVKRLTGGL
ncbi:TetR family transcriptional regulator [Paenibacillus sp. ACRRX]|uniref:TetR/AcrR family transcriptional regulator n=1 Tax=unclassified Paenibacillus TaxID=185978 RepID=UPI001EF422AC|nr:MULTISPECIES: TetR family transcriptional regulator [unclassified Paenibacillus]MCG7409582.1 TetR family transcriptional regulator [Paenibacillus sp. ACRRX]MDK8183341.1 TetR family transcriptional regulator [Paenibacillus sp. UMB4589-SE434]